MTQPAQDQRVADATDENWVDRFAPRATRPYLRLSRADRPIGTWLLLLPCWWSIPLAIAATGQGWSLYTIWLMIACGLGAILMRGAGCTWNDISDREFDAQVARTRSRPIPSGQVSAKQAAIWLAFQALVAFAILLTFRTEAIVMGIVSLLPVAIYPFAKRFTWWPQVFLGIAFNWGALLGWVAITGSLSLPPILLYLAGIAWTLFYDTIYAHQDKEDDALIGVRSTARLFGEKTRRWLFGFQVLSVLLAAAAVILALAPTGQPMALVICIAGIWGFGWHMAWQLRKLDTEDPEVCLMLFRANRDTGLILAAACLIASLMPG